MGNHQGNSLVRSKGIGLLFVAPNTGKDYGNDFQMYHGQYKQRRSLSIVSEVLTFRYTIHTII